MNLREHIVAAALPEIGVRESGGNNRGARIEVYQSATWLKPDDWPWCAAFCAWVLRKALITSGVSPAKADAWRCKDASAFGWIAWAQKNGCALLPASALPMPGDFVVFDFNGPTAAGGGHIGIIERDAPGATFHSIEGNTGVDGLRETTGGTDGVLRKVRGDRMVVNFIRVPERLA